MEHTWQSHHLPKLDVLNPKGGDVVVCGFPRGGASELSRAGGDRVAFVGPLGARSDLEWLLRGLLHEPGIGHVVLAGDDEAVVAESLLALWKEGLDEAGCIAGSRGRLADDLDAAAIDSLRETVQITDLRGRPPIEIAEAIAELPEASGHRDPRDPAAVEIPDRKVFLSRKTTFPIFSNGVADSWLQLLNLVMRIGAERTAEGERVAQVMNAVVTVGLPVIAEDLEVEDWQEPAEFADFLEFNQPDFERYYGLVTTASLAETVPGLVSTHHEETDGQLFGSFVLRAVDVHTEWPLQALALIRLHHETARNQGLEPGAVTFVIHAARLRDADWARAERILAESFKRPLPLQVDHSGIFLFGADKGRARAMLLDHEAGDIYWEDAFDTCEELSWYIVDAMPWLLPQHIRYVGQECSTLKRAIQEGACYEQG
jgi:tetrahydromethanopterin S-methyltransferase subunit A